MKTLLPVTSRASRARRTPAETICSNSSSRKWPASLRRFAPNVFVSISSAPARMKPTCSETTASGARRFASSGVRRRGTGARDERAHAAVADDRRAVLEAFDESVRCGHWDLPSLDILPGLSTRPGLAPCSGGRLPRRLRAGSLSLSRCGAGVVRPAPGAECSAAGGGEPHKVNPGRVMDQPATARRYSRKQRRRAPDAAGGAPNQSRWPRCGGGSGKIERRAGRRPAFRVPVEKPGLSPGGSPSAGEPSASKG